MEFSKLSKILIYAAVSWSGIVAADATTSTSVHPTTTNTCSTPVSCAGTLKSAGLLISGKICNDYAATTCNSSDYAAWAALFSKDLKGTSYGFGNDGSLWAFRGRPADAANVLGSTLNGNANGCTATNKGGLSVWDNSCNPRFKSQPNPAPCNGDYRYCATLLQQDGNLIAQSICKTQSGAACSQSQFSQQAYLLAVSKGGKAFGYQTSGQIYAFNIDATTVSQKLNARNRLVAGRCKGLFLDPFYALDMSCEQAPMSTTTVGTTSTKPSTSTTHVTPSIATSATKSSMTSKPSTTITSVSASQTSTSSKLSSTALTGNTSMSTFTTSTSVVTTTSTPTTPTTSATPTCTGLCNRFQDPKFQQDPSPWTVSGAMHIDSVSHVAVYNSTTGDAGSISQRVTGLSPDSSKSFTYYYYLGDGVDYCYLYFYSDGQQLNYGFLSRGGQQEDDFDLDISSPSVLFTISISCPTSDTSPQVVYLDRAYLYEYV